MYKYVYKYSPNIELVFFFQRIPIEGREHVSHYNNH